MNWASPLWLLLLPAVVALAGIVAVASHLHLGRLRKAFGEGLVDDILPMSVRVRRGLQASLALLGLGLVVVSIAEPRFDKQIRSVRAQGVDLVLLLDVSRSMDCADVEPSRLERARREVQDLFRILQGDRVGLVVYAGGAWPRLPLTEDLSAVSLVLSEADSSTFEAQGSALGDAIRTGLKVAERGGGGAGKALLILSDGEIHEGDDALAAADEAAAAGVVVYALGIGEKAAAIPLPEGGWMEWEGSRVSSVPDETVLREVARRTGGAYVKSVASTRDVAGLYEGEMRRKLTVVERETQQREVWRSAYQWPLGLGLLLLLAGAWLGDGRRALGAALGVLLVLGLAAVPAPAQAGPLADADRLFREQRYGEAAETLTELSLESPNNPNVLDRLGAARYRAGDFEGAARAWDQGAEVGSDRTDLLYNAGNAHWMAGRLEEAQERFKRVLESQPDHIKAQTNSGLLAAELEARRQQKPPPPPPSGEDGEDESQSEDGGENEGEGGGASGQDPNQNSDPNEQNSGEDLEGTDSEEQQDGDSEGTPELSELSEAEGDETEESEGTGAEGSSVEDAAPITEGQAERLLDGVEEGSQRVRVRGNRGGKPW